MMPHLFEIVILAISWACYYTIHSLLALDSVKTFFSKHLSTIFPFYRLFYNIFSTIGLIFLYLQYKNTSGHYIYWKVNSIHKWTALIVMIMGTLIVCISFRNYSFKEFVGTTTLSTANKKTSLNISGLNKYVRHPIYFGTFLFFWAYWISNATLCWLLISLITTTYLFIGARLEEAKLIKEFGKQYTLYKSQVKMLIPFIL